MCNEEKLTKSVAKTEVKKTASPIIYDAYENYYHKLDTKDGEEDIDREYLWAF